MILKFPKEINRKARSDCMILIMTDDCTLSFMRYIGFSHSHLDIFSHFGKKFFYSV